MKNAESIEIVKNTINRIKENGTGVSGFTSTDISGLQHLISEVPRLEAEVEKCLENLRWKSRKCKMEEANNKILQDKVKKLEQENTELRAKLSSLPTEEEYEKLRKRFEDEDNAKCS